VSPAVEFRPAQPSDWPPISELLTHAHLPLDGAREHLVGFTLAFRAGELIGTAALERYGCYGLLRSVAVRESERGQGLGVALVQAVLEHARREGLASLVLLTETASGFFPRFGFRPIARSDAPEPVKASVEFTTACADTATVMQLDL
jgi:amino-acid N-acetyltransferase